jgi:hypothetical protein
MLTYSDAFKIPRRPASSIREGVRRSMAGSGRPIVSGQSETRHLDSPPGVNLSVMVMASCPLPDCGFSWSLRCRHSRAEAR